MLLLSFSYLLISNNLVYIKKRSAVIWQSVL